MADQSLYYDVPGHRLICSSCYEWTDMDDLYLDPDGGVWDTCRGCGERWEIATLFLWMMERVR